MNKKFFVFGILFLAVFLSGCPEGEITGQYDNPNTSYYDSANDSSSGAVGGGKKLNSPAVNMSEQMNSECLQQDITAIMG